MSMIEVRMPQWGMNMTEGTVTQWLRKVGDSVEEGEAIVEIEAAKAANVVDAPVTGILAQILVEEDETVAVQTAICLIET
ncbi:biotin/lipoyl attachment domain-containing protein [Sphingomonas sp. LH128]|jgi:pyruvate/2-oxoglutarate dehydrogenase complex dihydrolipoamide acyltransferase (E2) component|uniref:lipoyl domain-containing protein n=1 Tax=Sphingomonas sp. LH128 TaxID=473781 RepID=UPI00027CA363|nr:lipoyl domain-containing protein [Sphingomonas sp. LH128]EJU12832.1 biotin/lipoyl attachment domain-containing protein [Sphingomonas sp. LH128]